MSSGSVFDPFKHTHAPPFVLVGDVHPTAVNSSQRNGGSIGSCCKPLSLIDRQPPNALVNTQACNIVGHEIQAKATRRRPAQRPQTTSEQQRAGVFPAHISHRNAAIT